MNFTHLHVHTEYSLLDGSNKIEDYVKRVKELGMDSAAITDHGVMYGVLNFYKAAHAAGINPVLGCEVYVAPGSRFDREVGGGEDRYYHLVLLAENNQGYSNLMKIVSRGFTEGYYYKPRIDLDLLREYHEGIIALSACLAGELARFLQRGMYEEAKIAALRYEEIFGKGNFFLELQDHGIPEQQLVNQQLVRMHRETGIELVATNDIHYTYADDAQPHDVLLCMQTGKKVSDENRMRYDGGQYYVKSPEEMAKLFPYAPEALENTYKIAHRCHVEIEFGVTKLPKFAVPEGYTSWEYLNKLCFDGLERRYGTVTDELKERLNYELSTIKNMGFVDYFLIVWDYVKFAKDHGIMVGPGRGSAAGSIVSYTLGITEIDPIRYDLFFERFLNPERVSMPDIDVDFGEGRERVIDYVVEKYGKDCVVQIITFGTLAARNAIRKVGSALDLPYAQVDTIAKKIPKELNITIDKALEVNPELKQMYDEQDDVRNLIDIARRLEGLPANVSMHAAGVVISQKSVDEYVPLALGKDGAVITEFEAVPLEELGLLKMDFLGLITLTVIQYAQRMIEKNHGVTLDMQKLSYNDKKVFDMLGKGHTDGVFQLESAGMKSFMQQLKPQTLDDVIAGIALYRPGPMDFIPQYIRGKNRPDTVTYDCPQMEPILKSTYGCIVYQEQVMQIVQTLAGYTLGRSDLVRRAMSKKKAHVMEQERRNFVYGNPEEGVPGCVANGIDEKTANKIYDEMMDFANYAFNKSHAVVYAFIAYQTAYLKCYYPVEFMAALLTTTMNNSSAEKVSEYISVCRQMNIPILPPDINCGFYDFSVEDGAIRYGLSAIKSVGRAVIEEMVAERETNGKYRTLEDFLERTTGMINKRAIENFIKAGALDCLDGNRRQKMMVFPQIMDEAAKQRKDSFAGQMSLFDIAGDEFKKDFEIKMPNVEEFDQEELLVNEKEVLGIYLSGHPLDKDRDLIEKVITARTSDFVKSEEGEEMESSLEEETKEPLTDGELVIIGGIITNVEVRYTRKNQAMATLTLEDLVGTVEVLVFPKDYKRWNSLLKEESRVFIQGRVSLEDERPNKLILSKVRSFDDIPKEVWIQFQNREDYAQKEAEMLSYLKTRYGTSSVVIYLKEEKAIKRLPSAYHVEIDESSIAGLRERYGESNVKIVERVLKNF